MIDAKTLADYQTCEKIAREHGRPLVEVLDAAGLLVTNDRHKSIRRVAFRDIVTHIEHQGPAKFLGVSYHTGRHTALDMYNGIIRWLKKEVLRERAS